MNPLCGLPARKWESNVIPLHQSFFVLEKIQATQKSKSRCRGFGGSTEDGQCPTWSHNFQAWKTQASSRRRPVHCQKLFNLFQGHYQQRRFLQEEKLSECSLGGGQCSQLHVRRGKQISGSERQFSRQHDSVLDGTSLLQGANDRGPRSWQNCSHASVYDIRIHGCFWHQLWWVWFFVCRVVHRHREIGVVTVFAQRDFMVFFPCACVILICDSSLFAETHRCARHSMILFRYKFTYWWITFLTQCDRNIITWTLGNLLTHGEMGTINSDKRKPKNRSQRVHLR